MVRLDPAAVVRLRDTRDGVALWAGTPFDVLVAARTRGSVEPRDVTVTGSDSLAALSVVDAPEVDPGAAVDGRWRGDLPGDGPWRAVGSIPAEEVDALVARITEAGPRRHGLGGRRGAGCPRAALVAVAGMGWPEDPAPLTVALSGDDAWMRVEVGDSAIVRRRRPRLALLT